VKGYSGPSRSASVDLNFSKALERCLEQPGPGRVTTCGAIARALGDIRASRAVAAWIVIRPDTPGGHRVVRADGRPVLASASRALSREGIRLFRGRVSADRTLDHLEPIGFLTALREEQLKLSERVIEQDGGLQVKRIAGVDAGYEGDTMRIVGVSLNAKDLVPVEVTAVKCQAEFPYIPTYLAYREFPGIEAAVRRLKRRPDVLLIDGHGRLHPALFGVACYVGVRLDLPTIGVAKHPLVGRVRPRVRSPSRASPIEFRGEVRGYAWTPPGRERPIYVSIGHRISLGRALEMVRGFTLRGYPEPLRLADQIGREMKMNKRNEKREKGATR
jgi:deoxyribonuclease V